AGVGDVGVLGREPHAQRRQPLLLLPQPGLDLRRGAALAEPRLAGGDLPQQLALGAHVLRRHARRDGLARRAERVEKRARPRLLAPPRLAVDDALVLEQERQRLAAAAAEREGLVVEALGFLVGSRLAEDVAVAVEDRNHLLLELEAPQEGERLLVPGARRLVV